MFAIDELHDEDFFTPEQMLELARAGRIYTAGLSAVEEQKAYPYFVLTGKAFDLSVPRLCWHVNASGQKDMDTRQGPVPQGFGVLYELDFAPAALRQDLMDYAHRRSFMMLFGWQGVHLRGDGQTQQEARLDAVNRLRNSVASGVLALTPEQVLGIESALLDARALLLDRRMLGRFTKPWPDAALAGEADKTDQALTMAAPEKAKHLAPIAAPVPAQTAQMPSSAAGSAVPAAPATATATARVPRSVRYAPMRQRA